MGHIKKVFPMFIILLTAYSVPSLAASSSVSITNQSVCNMQVYANGAKSTLKPGASTKFNMSEGQATLYLYGTVSGSPSCGTNVSIANLQYYYDSSRSSYVTVVQQGATSVITPAFSQQANLNDKSYTVNSGQIVKENAPSSGASISTTVSGGNK